MKEAREKALLQKGSLILILLAVTAVFLRMIAAFLIPLLLAALFSGLAYPLYRRFVGFTRGRESTAAALTLLVIVTVVVIPLTVFLGIVVNQAGDMTSSVAPLVGGDLGHGRLIALVTERLPQSVQDLLPTADQILAKVGELAGRIGSFLVNSMAALTRGTASFFLSMFILLYAMYFFLVGGRKVLDRFLFLLPLNSAQESRLLERFTSVTRATVKGTLVIGAIQGALGGLGFFFVGLSGAAFWGTIMAVLSMIPLVGAALVWLPAGLYLLAVGKIAKGLFLLLWCLVVVSSSDNVLRPRLVGRDAKMPDLMIMVGTLGGLAMFGATGVILGPLMAALFITVWDLYGEAFGEELEERAPSGDKRGDAATV